ncbi:hypothetical protein SISNIDRAFT_257637 [Sistotremastrum niveocremeum HHB9708]|uniref:Uncharacterized protein n=1 Tax=Sistotremastrum niveocremeum HHB9708 TaxID=1314777 RepID=A0A164PC84_9AGAM|nr:hypothetical protein SISNIDRAFT_257637 [Sistotremastrum niveocremeum HHB9708]
MQHKASQDDKSASYFKIYGSPHPLALPLCLGVQLSVVHALDLKVSQLCEFDISRSRTQERRQIAISCILLLISPPVAVNFELLLPIVPVIRQE